MLVQKTATCLKHQTMPNYNKLYS